MTKTVQAQYMNFNKLARLWLPQHFRMSDSLSSFKRQLAVMYDNTWSEKHMLYIDITATFNL